MHTSSRIPGIIFDTCEKQGGPSIPQHILAIFYAKSFNVLAIDLLLRSESELTSCSLQVLSTAGSPGRALLARLADRSCSLDFLLHCLRKMDHQEAVRYLTTTCEEV